MDQKPQKFWVREVREPSEKYRQTIFTTDKNLKDQYANYNGKRWLQDIKDQTSFVYHMDKVIISLFRKIMTEVLSPHPQSSSE
jgi:hypothetical protein